MEWKFSMLKNITTQGLKAAVGEIIDGVRLRGDQYVIERRGKPVAALVPIHALRAMERGRERLFALMEEVASRNEDAADENLAQVIDEEIRAMRAERKCRKP